jgi:hypothetical protein
MVVFSPNKIKSVTNKMIIKNDKYITLSSLSINKYSHVSLLTKKIY